MWMLHALSGFPISWSYFSAGTFRPVATAVSLAGFFVCFFHLPLIQHNPSVSRTGWRRNKKNNEGVKLASPVFSKLYTWTLLSQASTYSLWCWFYLCGLQRNSTILMTFHMPHCLPEHFLTRAKDSQFDYLPFQYQHMPTAHHPASCFAVLATQQYHS